MSQKYSTAQFSHPSGTHSAPVDVSHGGCRSIGSVTVRGRDRQPHPGVICDGTWKIGKRLYHSHAAQRFNAWTGEHLPHWVVPVGVFIILIPMLVFEGSFILPMAEAKQPPPTLHDVRHFHVPKPDTLKLYSEELRAALHKLPVRASYPEELRQMIPSNEPVDPNEHPVVLWRGTFCAAMKHHIRGAEWVPLGCENWAVQYFCDMKQFTISALDWRPDPTIPIDFGPDIHLVEQNPQQFMAAYSVFCDLVARETGRPNEITRLMIEQARAHNQLPEFIPVNE